MLNSIIDLNMPFRALCAVGGEKENDRESGNGMADTHEDEGTLLFHFTFITETVEY